MPITVNPASLPNGATGTPYNQTVTASSGTAPYTFAVSAGALPTAWRSTPHGAITGTPTAAGTFNFTIQATDSNASTGNRAYSDHQHRAADDQSGEPAGRAGGHGVQPDHRRQRRQRQLQLCGDRGSLPTGLALNPATGAITGTPTAGGTFNFTIQAHRHLAEHRHASL